MGMAIAQTFVFDHQPRLTRPSTRPFANLWLLASLVGGAAQVMLGRLSCAAMCQSLPSVLVGLPAGIGWGGYGLVTGLALLLGPMHDVASRIEK